MSYAGSPRRQMFGIGRNALLQACVDEWDLKPDWWNPRVVGMQERHEDVFAVVVRLHVLAQLSHDPILRPVSLHPIYVKETALGEHHRVAVEVCHHVCIVGCCFSSHKAHHTTSQAATPFVAVTVKFLLPASYFRSRPGSTSFAVFNA